MFGSVGMCKSDNPQCGTEEEFENEETRRLREMEAVWDGMRDQIGNEMKRFVKEPEDMLVALK